MSDLAKIPGPLVIGSVLEDGADATVRRAGSLPRGCGLVEVRADRLTKAEIDEILHRLDRPVLVTVRRREDGGRFEHPQTGLATREVREEVWRLQDGDPLSMTGEARWTCEKDREGWSVRTESSMRLACTREDWLVSGDVAAFEGGREVFHHAWEKRIPRDLM